MFLMSILLIGLPVSLLVWQRLSVRAAAWQFFPLTAALLLDVFYIVSDYFTGSGVDESVIYHLQVGLDGAGFKEYSALLALIIFILLMWIVTYIVLIRRASNKSNGYGVLAIFLSVSAIVCNPAIHDLYGMYFGQAKDSKTNGSKKNEDIAKNYVQTTALKADGETFNVIYIYAESLEETYFDEELFPGLMPNLKKLREQSIVFTNVGQVSNSGWTIAGIVASQCGVPLFMSGGGNSLSGMKYFLKGATCMGDLLRDSGYFLSYIGGASTRFAGKGNFLNTHGFHNIQGKEELEKRQTDKSYQSGWGVYDDELFDFARQELDQLTKTNEKFGLFLLTLDTHHPRGHLSRSCTVKYPHQNDPMLDAIHCSDQLIASFINAVRANKKISENTVVVLGSDHLAMKNTLYESLQNRQRKNFFMILHPERSSRNVDAKATTLDTGVTVLSAMGFDVEQLGFGRNMLADSPSLAASVDGFELRLHASSEQLKYLWRYPVLYDGVRFNSSDSQMFLGRDQYTYPLLLLIDENMAVQDAFFDFYSDVKNEQHLYRAHAGQRYIWVDECEKIALAYAQLRISKGYCMVAGRLGASRMLIERIEPGMEVGMADLQRIFKKKRSVKHDVYARQRDAIAALGLVNSDERLNIEVETLPYKEIKVISKAGPASGESQVSYTLNDDSQRLESSDRGLNVLIMQPGEAPRPIYRFDGCGRESGTADNSRLSDILHENGNKLFLILVHDSAHCGDLDGYAGFVSGSGLMEAEKLGVRDGYVAMIVDGKVVYETSGIRNQSAEVLFYRK